VPQVSNILIAITGIAAGGVANVLADDLPARQRPRQPHCPYCGHPRHPLAWLGLGALLSNQGRCAACSRSLPWRHLAVELTLAAAFVFLWGRYGPSSVGLFFTLYVWLSVLITVIDVEHRLILHVVMGPAILLALVEAAVTPRLPFLDALLGGAIGFGVVFGIFVAGEGFRRLLARLRGETIDEVAFGYGDVTLATFAGLVVGRESIGLTLVLMVFIGGIVAGLFLLYRGIIRRNYSVFTALPYGPNIIIAMLVILIWQKDLGVLLRQALYGGGG